MRVLLVIRAGMPLGMERRAGGGASPLEIDTGGATPFSGEVLSAKSRIHFGSRRTSSGIAARPSGRGYCSRRRWRRVTDQGTNEPSTL